MKQIAGVVIDAVRQLGLLPLCVVWLLAGTATARAIDDAQRTLDYWNSSVRRTGQLLKAQEYRAALRAADYLLTEMMERVGRGEVAARLLGIAVAQKAVAHAGIGHAAEADWYWASATSIFPEIANSDLSVFGRGAATLSRPRPRRPTDTADDCTTPPKLLKLRKPTFPLGAYELREFHTVVVEVIITKSGEVISPRIVSPVAAPTLAYAALDALRTWRFEPCHVNGAPIEVIFEVTVRFV